MSMQVKIDRITNRAATQVGASCYRTKLVCCLLGLSFTLYMPAYASDPDWSLDDDGLEPTPRYAHAMAYDSARGVVVLFGGWEPGHDNETWEWDGETWIQEADSGPSPRREHAMVYDSCRGVVVLFGGRTDEGLSNETWEWDGSNWTDQTPESGPSPSVREEHAMAFDSNRCVTVLFGGHTGFDIASDETWEWDGSNWIQRDPISKPSARWDHAMAYDSCRHEVILFGGYSNEIARNDTWKWNGETWVELGSPFIPLPRADHAMAFDAGCCVAVLFGGADADAVGPSFDDTWVWNGSKWAERSPNVHPSARWGHAMAQAPKYSGVVLFSGYDDDSRSVYYGDTWSYRDCANPIPTVSSWGLCITFLLIVTCGTILFRSRNAAIA